MSLDLAPAIRAALIGCPAIANNLKTFVDGPAVFTRRPIPDGAAMPLAIVNPDAAIGDQDYLNASLPIVVRDVIFYGNQPGDYRLVEQMAYAARDLFHRRKWAITPEGYDVIDIVVRGPIPGPTDDQKTVARMVGLTIQLRRQA